MFFKELGLDWKQAISSRPKISPNPIILTWGPHWKPRVTEASSLKIMIFFSVTCTPCICRAVIKRWGLGFFPSYCKCGPQLLSKENKRKIEPKEIPRCLIPRLLVVFTRQLEIFNWHPWCICSILNLILILLCNPESLS